MNNSPQNKITQICAISNLSHYDFLFNRIFEEYPGHSFYDKSEWWLGLESSKMTK